MTADDLASAVAAHRAGVLRRPVIKLGHVGPMRDASPALGYVDNLRTADGGTTLVGDGQQSIDQQHDAIAAAGVTPDRVFTDTASGRAGSMRPGWAECMGWLREGDHLVVVAVDRLGRSVREVATALHELTNRGVHVRSLREGVDTSTPTGRAPSPASWRPSPSWSWKLGKERRAASREARVARGLAATKPMKLDAAQQKRLLRLYQQGEPVSELTSMFGISRSTLFRTIKVLKVRELA